MIISKTDYVYLLQTRYLTTSITRTSLSVIPRTTTVTKYNVGFTTVNEPIERIVYRPVTNYVTKSIDFTKTAFLSTPVLLPTRSLATTTLASQVTAIATSFVTSYNVVTSTSYVKNYVDVTGYPTYVTETTTIFETVTAPPVGGQAILAPATAAPAAPLLTVTRILQADHPDCLNAIGYR